MAISRMALATFFGSLASGLVIATLLLLGLSRASAQPPAPPEPDGGVGTAELEVTVARDSPRASMQDFLRSCEHGDFATAAGYLELSSERRSEGARLARRLKAVLDRKAWVETDALSPLPGGDAEDGLPGYTDELGRIEAEDGTLEPVRIVRRKRDGVRWLFSSATVGRVDGWYQRLDDRFVLEHMPEPLLRQGPRHLVWWQWLALPLLVSLSFVCALALSYVTTKLLAKLAARSGPQWDDVMVERLKRPLTLFWTLVVLYVLLPWLALYEPAEEFVLGAIQTVFLGGLFWALSRIVDVIAQMIFRSPWASTREASGSLVSLGARVAKVAVVAIAAVALISQLGYPVASILAGLGVGGLAVALAAQKTVENLFGAFSIGADQPFREGDLVRVDNFMGTVELIGLRSTKFRTPDRTLISIPNGKLAEMRLETFAVRDRLRFAMIVALVQRTTEKQLRQVIEGIELRLKAQPKLAENSATVRLEKFGVSSFDIEVIAYFETRDWREYQLIRQELLLQFMALIENAGTSLALPSSTVHLVPAQPPPSGEEVQRMDAGTARS